MRVREDKQELHLEGGQGTAVEEEKSLREQIQGGKTEPRSHQEGGCGGWGGSQRGTRNKCQVSIREAGRKSEVPRGGGGGGGGPAALGAGLEGARGSSRSATQGADEQRANSAAAVAVSPWRRVAVQ